MANNPMPAALDDRKGFYEQDYYSWALSRPVHFVQNNFAVASS
jgi:hypothetical protein